MSTEKQYYWVNWIDGMKINKNHFIQQDNANIESLQEAGAVHLNALHYGLVPANGSLGNFNVKISFDNQQTLRVAVQACQAITQSGCRIALPLLPSHNTNGSGNDTLNAVFPFASAGSEQVWWIFLLVNPFEKQAAGNPDTTENPPRLPYVIPTYKIELVSDSQLRNFSNHPYGLPVGKINVNGDDVKTDDDYIPPCYSINAHPDLLSLHGELDKYLAETELYCSQIVQKIFRKNQQNEISELVLFLCDRVMQFLGPAITSVRWKMVYDAPVELFICMAGMARIMKNAIDMRIGSGKDELMTYLSDWCELKQGELETMLGNLANSSFNNNDINASIQKVVYFVKITSRLFETLSKLEFIGKKKESGIFVKEEPVGNGIISSEAQKAKRRFFGG